MLHKPCIINWKNKKLFELAISVGIPQMPHPFFIFFKETLRPLLNYDLANETLTAVNKYHVPGKYLDTMEIC